MEIAPVFQTFTKFILFYPKLFKKTQKIVIIFMVKNMLWLSIFLIIVIIVCLIGIYYAVSFNTLNDLKTKIHEAESIIDESLRNKYDISQRELTAILDFGKMTINRYENGSLPSKSHSDYLRLIFARVGVPYCPNHNIPISSQSVEEMTNKVLEYPLGTKIIIMAPVVHGEKGTQKDLLEHLRKEGYIRVRVDDEMVDLSEEIILDKNKKARDN